MDVLVHILPVVPTGVLIDVFEGSLLVTSSSHNCRHGGLLLVRIAK